MPSPLVEEFGPFDPGTVVAPCGGIRMRFIFALGVAALLAVASPSRAQLIAYESFPYSASSILDGQGTAGMGFGGTAATWTASPSPARPNVATIQAGSLTPAAPSAALTTAGNSLRLPPFNDSFPGGVYRTLSSPVGATGTTTWLSVVMLGNGLNASISQGSISLTNGPDSVTHLFSDGFNITTGTQSSATWSVSGVAGATPVSSGVSNSLQSLLVTRITFGTTTDTVDLFVNPALGASPPASPQASITIAHVASLSVVRLSMSSLVGSTDATMFDEIRLGGTFADVVAVPEPSTMLLVGTVGLGLIAHRRKKMPRNLNDGVPDATP
jgi:hypothetical protein